LRRLAPIVICGIAALLVSPAGAQTPVLAPAVAPVAVSNTAVSPGAAPLILAPQAAAFECKTPPEFVRLDQPLRHTARRLAADEPLTIVAIGSSSTRGAGASSPAASYPSRLAAELGKRFPRDDVTVLNRGVNGEEIDQMLARFPNDVIAAHPDLVLWQVGTNAVLRDRQLQPDATMLRDGIKQIKDAGADALLMDMQFAPRVLAKPETPDMEGQIARAAKEGSVDLFNRFAVMREWHDVQHMPFEAFVAPDGLHMNDWGYDCVAKLLAGAITEAATRPVASAAAAPSVH
jgi:lysophospholipase L1-like esterase